MSTMTNCAAIHCALSNIVGLEKLITEHVEKDLSQIRHVILDFHKVKSFLLTYSPLEFTDVTQLISL
jgi:hypothetical protein